MSIINRFVNVSFFVNGCKGTAFFGICKRFLEKNIIFFFSSLFISEL